MNKKNTNMSHPKECSHSSVLENDNGIVCQECGLILDNYVLNYNANSTHQQQEENYRYATEFTELDVNDLHTNVQDINTNVNLSRQAKKLSGSTKESTLYNHFMKVIKTFHREWFLNVHWLLVSSQRPENIETIEANQQLQGSMLLLYKCKQFLPITMLQLISDYSSQRCCTCCQYIVWHDLIDNSKDINMSHSRFICKECFRSSSSSLLSSKMEKTNKPTNQSTNPTKDISALINTKIVEKYLIVILEQSLLFQSYSISHDMSYFAIILVVLKTTLKWNHPQFIHALMAIQRRYVLEKRSSSSSAFDMTRIQYLVTKLEQFQPLVRLLNANQPSKKDLFSDEREYVQQFLIDTAWPIYWLDIILFRIQELYWTSENYTPLPFIRVLVLLECEKNPEYLFQNITTNDDQSIVMQPHALEWKHSYLEQTYPFHTKQWNRRYQSFVLRKQDWWQRNQPVKSGFE
jgi:hypothetical protein